MTQCIPIQPVYQVLAMSRSGHHAFIEWSIAQLGGTAVHHNYVRDGVPTESYLYKNGINTGTTILPVPEGAWETSNVENSLPSDPLPFDCKTIIFMRDIYNNMASRIKAGKTKPEHGGLGVEVWIAQAKEALRITQHINNPVIVKYDEWKHHANWTKESIAYNRGSSFGSIMGTNRRWEIYKDDNDYIEQVINNKEAANLNKQLFGWSI